MFTCCCVYSRRLNCFGCGLYPPVPVKQIYRTMEQARGQLKRTHQQMSMEPNPIFQQPILVIWKGKSVTLPEYTRCVVCKDRMCLWIDVSDARRRKDHLKPVYKCRWCSITCGFAEKFDPNKAFADAAWPTVRFSSPPIRVRNFDDEVEKAIQHSTKEYLRRKRNRARRACKDPLNHLSEDIHCGCSVPGDATTSDPKIPVAQEAVNPRMPIVGDTTTYSLYKLAQKVLVVAGRVESEDAEIDEGIMRAVSAQEFLDSFTTLLASENGEAE